jgi:hypothetical protein
VRTEDDLRAALSTLERHAPDAARVLPGRERRFSHGLRSARAGRWLAAAATAAALAGLVAALTLPAAPTRSSPNGGVAVPSSPSGDVTLRARVLAAFSAAGQEIGYASSTSQTTGASPIVTETWTYPSQPKPGQRVRIRTLTYNRSGTLRYDDVASYVVTGHPASGERIIINYVGRTFSDQQDTPLPESVGLSSSALVASYIKTAHWTVRRTTLNGRAALELSFKDNSKENPSTFHVWVDATTYLLLRETATFGPPGQTTSSTDNDQYLPVTTANLAQLSPPVPTGFRQVTQGGQN